MVDQRPCLVGDFIPLEPKSWMCVGSTTVTTQVMRHLIYPGEHVSFSSLILHVTRANTPHPTLGSDEQITGIQVGPALFKKAWSEFLLNSKSLLTDLVSRQC